MKRLQSSAFDGAWINYMATEEVDPRFADLDAWSLTSAMEAMWEGQLAAVAAIRRALPAITAATEAAKAALGDHGRIVYVGAGTSGHQRRGRRSAHAGTDREAAGEGRGRGQAG